jgi:hypothetical protein
MIVSEWRRWAALQQICVDLGVLIGVEVARREGRERRGWKRQVMRFERGFAGGEVSL